MYRDFCGENRLSLKIFLFYFVFARSLRSAQSSEWWVGYDVENCRYKWRAGEAQNTRYPLVQLNFFSFFIVRGGEPMAQAPRKGSPPPRPPSPLLATAKTRDLG